mgnify:FL=1
MKVQNRIEQAPACEIIAFNKDELKFYKGCGASVAGFRDGQLEKIHYALDFVSDPEDDFQQQADKAVKVAIEKAKAFEEEGLELWVGICSCSEFCEPFKLDFTDARSLATLARIIGDEIIEY